MSNGTPNSIAPPAAPPVAAKDPVTITRHGDSRVDEYAWLRDPGYPDVTDAAILDYLKAENAYREAVMAPHAALVETLFEELKGRIKDDDAGVPYRSGPYHYNYRYPAGAQYPVFQRSGRDALPDDGMAIVLDQNALAEGKPFCRIRASEPSHDHALLAYSADFDGSERFEIRFRDLATGEDLPDIVPNTQGIPVWAADGGSVFYMRLDDELRARTLCRHVLGTPVAEDRVLYHEEEVAFLLHVTSTSDRKFLLLEGGDHDRQEMWLLPTDAPDGDLVCVAPRRDGHEYHGDHHDGWLYIVTNDRHENFRLVRAPIDDPGETGWEEVMAPSDDVFLTGLHAFSGHLAIEEREAGLPHIRIRRMADGADHRIDFGEADYDVGLSINAEFDSPFVRLSYTSLATPNTVLDYDFETRETSVRKVQEIPSGYDRDAYVTEREMAPAPDGTLVPVSIVRRKDTTLDGSAPLYLYAYGSYGHSIDPYFSTARLSLLDRGWVFALAHPRGGSEMGRAWYETGKLAHKVNTFTDVIACGRHLAKTGHTSEGLVTVVGGSAGGLMVGACVNMAPDLFKAGVAHVPFVDVVNTMLDDSLWLTASEFTEWGNPIADPDAYFRIKSYSPYDNVEAKAYPHLFVSGGIADPRVTYWEPAKWVARLRDRKTDDNLIVMRMNMDAGHGGSSGRWDHLKEVAEEYAFLFKVYGMLGD